MPAERMISRIDIKNFKSIKEAHLDLRPLTVLVGENSAGKSSVLQSLLLLAQITRGHTRPDIVALNGPDLKLGNFADAIHGGDPTKALELALTVPVRGQVLARAYSGRWVTARRAQMRFGGESPLDGAKWLLELGDSPSELGVARVNRIEIDDSLDGVRLEVWPNEDQLEVANLYDRSRDLGILRPTLRGRGRFVGEAASAATFRGKIEVEAGDAESEQPETLPAIAVENGFPVDLYAYESESLALAKQWVTSALRESGVEPVPRRTRPRPSPTENPLNDADQADAGELGRNVFPEFRKWVDARDRHAQPDRPSWDQAIAGRVFVLGDAVPGVLAGLLEEVREDRGAVVGHSSAALSVAASLSSLLYGSMHYLGPLREDPSTTYRPAQEGGVATLGTKGESTVALLHMYRTQLVDCPIDGRVEPKPLSEAVDYWTRKFGFAATITTHDQGKAGVGLELLDPQTSDARDLTSVGVGASQLLPVIVLCLFAQKGELVLIEQPELHLHPGPQQILGDFLLGIAESGRQLIVETHSEYFINRLRLRVVEDEFGATEELVRIWYATRTDGQTHFKAMEPDRFGSFDDWPDGFFDQTPIESEAILRAIASKRRAR